MRLDAIEAAIRELAEVPAQLRALCAKIEDLRLDRRDVDQWRREADASLLTAKKDLDALHSWKRDQEGRAQLWDVPGLRRDVKELSDWRIEHDVRLERQAELKEGRQVALRNGVMAPLVTRGVLALLSLLGLGLLAMLYATLHHVMVRGP